jgi:hypothetical protein
MKPLKTVRWATQLACIASLAAATVALDHAAATAFTFTTDRSNCGGPSGCNTSITGVAVNTLDFDTTLPVSATGDYQYATGAASGPLGLSAAPLGDTTQYFAVTAAGSNPINATATINFAGSTNYYMGFYWGSVDLENTVSFYSGQNGTGTRLGVLTGNDVAPPGAGFQNDPAENVYLNAYFSQSVGSAVFNTTKIAFEVDNVSTAVPEPTTMIGLGVASAFGWWCKRRQKQQAA